MIEHILHLSAGKDVKLRQGNNRYASANFLSEKTFASSKIGGARKLLIWPHSNMSVQRRSYSVGVQMLLLQP